MERDEAEMGKEVMMADRIFAVILIILVLVFVLQNIEVVKVSFLAWDISMPRALMIFGALIIGIIVGWLARRPKRKG